MPPVGTLTKTNRRHPVRDWLIAYAAATVAIAAILTPLAMDYHHATTSRDATAARLQQVRSEYRATATQP